MKGEEFVAIISAILWLVGFGLFPTIAQGQPVAEGTHIPVIINLYPNSGVTEQQARDAVKEANKLLEQAGFDMRVVKVNDPPGAGNGDDGDGVFTKAERGQIRTFGGKELNKLKNQKGIKISFGKEAKSENTNTDGVSVHRDPTIIVKYIDAKKTGYTIAHEFGHVMTNAGESNDPTDIMYGSGYDGTKFSQAEINEMKKRKYVHGKCSVQWNKDYPAVKEEQQFGGSTDDRGDQSGGAPGFYDVHQVFMYSLSSAASIDAQITSSGVLPDTGMIDARYALGLDTDNSTLTGIAFADKSGIDRIVFINLTGDKSLGNFNVIGEIKDTVSGTTQSMPGTPVVETANEFSDFNNSQEPVATDILFSILKNLLNLSAVEVPVVVVAGNSTYTLDTDNFTFDSQRWQDDPTLTTFGTGAPTAGENYPLEISGLEPNQPFDLYLNDIPVLSGTLDGSGSYSGGFIFPNDAPVNRMYFLTAQDSTGEFAYLISCPSISVPTIGGVIDLIDKAELLAQYIVLVAFVISTLAVATIYIKHRRKQ